MIGRSDCIWLQKIKKIYKKKTQNSQIWQAITTEIYTEQSNYTAKALQKERQN